MITVTADDIRVLAQSDDVDPVLALVDGRLVVLPAEAVDPTDQVVLTRVDLVAEVGEDVTDVEAEVLAGGLTARLAGGPSTEDDVSPGRAEGSSPASL
jgi:hypothetical protein